MESLRLRLLVFLVLSTGVTGSHYWTGWTDFDNPSGIGDFEKISNHPTANDWRPCGGRTKEFIHVRAKNKAKSDILTSDLLTVGQNYGLKCSGAFSSGKCRDYREKYYNKFGTGSSSWLDASNPSPYSETELKPGTIPVSKYMLITAKPYPRGHYRVHQKIKLGPRYGLECRNSDQPGAEICLDYEVRYYCGDYPTLVITGLGGFKAPGK